MGSQHPCRPRRRRSRRSLERPLLHLALDPRPSMAENARLAPSWCPVESRSADQAPRLVESGDTNERGWPTAPAPRHLAAPSRRHRHRRPRRCPPALGPLVLDAHRRLRDLVEADTGGPACGTTSGVRGSTARAPSRHPGGPLAATDGHGSPRPPPPLRLPGSGRTGWARLLPDDGGCSWCSALATAWTCRGSAWPARRSRRAVQRCRAPGAGRASAASLVASRSPRPTSVRGTRRCPSRASSRRRCRSGSEQTTSTTAMARRERVAIRSHRAWITR